MTAPIERGFRIATGFLKVTADTREAKRETDRFLRRTDRDMDAGGRRAGRSFGTGLAAGLLPGLGRIARALIGGIGAAVLGVTKLSALGIVAGTVGIAIAGLGGAIVGLMALLNDLAAAAIAAAGALLLIPGAIAQLIGVVVVAKLGMKGFGDAMKAVATGDAEKLNEALKKLAPNAAATVKVLAGFKPAFERMRLAVQDRLFASIAVRLRDLGRTHLPILHTGLVAIGAALNGLVLAAFDVLAERVTQADLARIFDNTARSVTNLGTALRPLLRIVRDVTAVGSAMFTQLTGGLTPALDRFAGRVATMRAEGDLAGLITDGLAALGHFKDLAVDIFGIIKGIFGPAGSGGAFAFFDRLNKIVNSATGQAALKDLFESLTDAGVALTPVLLALLKALVPVADGLAKIAVAFGPGLMEIATALGDALGKDLVPGIVALAPLLSTLASGLRPLAQVLAQLVVASAPGLNNFLLALVDGLKTLAESGIATTVGRALADLLTAAAPLVEPLANLAVILLGGLATGLSAVAAVLGPTVKLFSGKFAEVLDRLIVPLGIIAADLLPRFVAVGVQFAQTFLQAIQDHMPEILLLLNEMVSVTLQLAQVMGAELVQTLIELIPLLPSLVVSGIALAQAITHVLEAVIPLLPYLTDLRFAAIVLPGLMFLLAAALETASLQLRIIGGFINWVRGLFSGASTGVEQFGNTAKEQVGKAVATFRGLGTTILNAVGNLGGLLYDAGRNLIQGLINGVKAMAKPFTDQLSGLARIARDFWPFSPAKRGPLSGAGDLRLAGAQIPGRLALGIMDGAPALMRIAEQMADMFRIDTPGAAPAVAGAGGGSMSFGPTLISVRIGDRVIDDAVEEVVVTRPEMVAAAADVGFQQRGFKDPGRKRFGTPR